MADRNIPVLLNDETGNLVRVGWASTPDSSGKRDIRIDTSGIGKEIYDLVLQGPAQGFTYGKPVSQEENN